MLFLPLSSCAFCLTHSISLPFVPQGVCCRPWWCLNLGVRTHRAAGVYSTATPVKNTLPWKYSHSVHSKTPRKIRLSAKQVQVHEYSGETFSYRNSWRLRLQSCLAEVWVSNYFLFLMGVSLLPILTSVCSGILYLATKLKLFEFQCLAYGHLGRPDICL